MKRPDLEVGGLALALRRRGCGWDQLAELFDIADGREAEALAAKWLVAARGGAGRDLRASVGIGYRRPRRGFRKL